MNKAHLNATSPESYDSDVALFGFNKSDQYLSVGINDFERSLFPIERVNIYLKDKRILANVFIVYNNYFYYYEEDTYYGHVKEDYPKSPIKNILEKYNFDISDIELIISTNIQESPSVKIFDFFTRSTDRYIDDEVIIKFDKWDELPNYSEYELIYEI